MKIALLFALFGMALLTFATCTRADVSFVREIAPIILKRCVGCHGDKINLGGYRANTFEFMMKRTASGAQPVKPGDPEKSRQYIDSSPPQTARSECRKAMIP